MRDMAINEEKLLKKQFANYIIVIIKFFVNGAEI